jgi:hypothetical protein
LNLIALTISLTISLIGYQLYSTSLSSSSSSPSPTIPSSSSSPPKLLTAHTDLNDPIQHHHQQQAFGPFMWIFFGLLPFWILRFLTDLIATCVDTLLSSSSSSFLLHFSWFFFVCEEKENHSYFFLWGCFRFLCWNIDLDIGTNHSNLTRQAVQSLSSSLHSLFPFLSRPPFPFPFSKTLLILSLSLSLF